MKWLSGSEDGGSDPATFWQSSGCSHLCFITFLLGKYLQKYLCQAGSRVFVGFFFFAEGWEGWTEMEIDWVLSKPNLVPPTSPPQADRKKYLPVRGNKTEKICFYFLTLLKIKSGSWLLLCYAGMCINFNTGNICHQFILFLIILCSACAGKTRSPGLFWLDNRSARTNGQTSTALFLKKQLFSFP